MEVGEAGRAGPQSLAKAHLPPDRQRCLASVERGLEGDVCGVWWLGLGQVCRASSS